MVDSNPTQLRFPARAGFTIWAELDGGAMYGKWRGLLTQKLDQGVGLAVTTEYRAVLEEPLVACGLTVKDSFPDWRSEGHLGLFRAG